MPQGNLPEEEVLPKQFRILDTSYLEYFCFVGFLYPGAHDPAVAVMKTKACFKRRATAVLSGLDHRRTGRGGEGGCSPPKFWATQVFWAARENLGKASF